MPATEHQSSDPANVANAYQRKSIRKIPTGMADQVTNDGQQARKEDACRFVASGPALRQFDLCGR